MRAIQASILALCLTAFSFGQSKVIRGTYLTADDAVVEMVGEGVEIFVEGLKPEQRQTVAIQAQYDNALVRAYNQAKPFPPITLSQNSRGHYPLTRKGIFDIEILAIVDGRWSSEYLEDVQVGIEPTPDPDNPVDPVDPIPEPEIDNTYGVGLIAYRSAPNDKDSAKAFSDVYKQAADFLYGVPTIKNLYSENSDEDVFKWIDKQITAYPCKSKEVCDKWQAWKKDVFDAMVKSQRNRQLSRDDWHRLFMEVSNALGKKA